MGVLAHDLRIGGAGGAGDFFLRQVGVVLDAGGFFHQQAGAGVEMVDGELHSDEESVLLEQGSKQENLWGINIYPDETGDSFIEFDSMIINRNHSERQKINSHDLPAEPISEMPYLRSKVPAP